MIELTRLNGKTFTLNAFLIEQIEAHPDTTISLITGKKIVVKEHVDIVQKKIIDLYKMIGLVPLHHLEKGGDACLKAKS